MDKNWMPRVEIVLHLGDGGDAHLTETISAEQYERYRTHPEDVITEAVGAPFPVWYAWREAAGRPLCMGTTVSGKPCKRTVPGVRLPTPKDWANYGGGYCEAHGAP